MCFSAEASFVAAGVLTSGGVASFRQVQQRGDMLLACVPVLFGIHQVIEGLLWISLRHSSPEPLTTGLTYAFAIIATSWPTLAPVTMLVREPGALRRRIWWVLLVVGGLTTGYLLTLMLVNGVSARIHCHSIRYVGELPYEVLIRNVYTFVIMAAYVLSRFWLLRLVGIGILVSLHVSLYAFAMTYPSVWCFMAAGISLLIYVHLWQQNRPALQTAGPLDSSESP